MLGAMPAVRTERTADVSVDVVIVGAGFAGATLACALARGGLQVAVVDRQSLEAMAAPGFDGRASAVSLSSKRLLAAVGIWRHLAGEAQPIEDIRVSDARDCPRNGGGDASHLFLHYDHRDVGDEPFGYMVENRHLRQAMLNEIATARGAARVAPATVGSIERTLSEARVALADGRALHAPLVVAADGRKSFVRSSAGIPMTEWSYPQVGIVCTVAHERAHRGVAHERFLSSGPFAMLPLTGNRSSIVWTERRHLARTYMNLGAVEFEAEVARRFGDFLGSVEVIGERWCHPLSFLHAARYVEPRLALIGDAAHGMHPVAGQGVNMGWRDVGALAEVLVDANRLGLDLGGVDVLERYQRWRRFDNLAMLLLTDGLNRLFSNNIGPVRLARDLGLAAVNNAPPLKRFLMRYAMGLVGELPRLMQGEAL